MIPSRPPLAPLAAAALLAWSPSAFAQNTAALPAVEVIGSAEKLPKLAGAGQIVEADELEASRVLTVNEALRKVAGVNVRDEEGFGLRPNIAVRGLNPTRSTKVTLLEDGLPLAYAPYGDNASYYHPPIERFQRIEVLKGASSLLFGPQTVGGVINYVTPPPPETVGGYFQGVAGNRDYSNLHFNVGGGGWLFDLIRKEGDGSRDNLAHRIHDVNLKFATPLTSSQSLIVRLNYYQEDSTVTYSGLTQAEFQNLGPRYNPFRNDSFDAERRGASATHEWDINPVTVLTTSVYYAYFSRDWWRQASNSQDTQCEASSPGFNAARLAGTVVNPDTCNSVQGRLRDYTTTGIEPRLTVANRLGEFQAGFKLHREKQERLQVNGTTPTARTGTTVENNLRETDAQAVYVAQRFDFGTVSITPIVRHERIDADRGNRLTSASGSTDLSETTPGLGLTWNPTPKLTVFASAHEGFAPPRVEDLVGNTGTVTDVDAEKSRNYEIGVRGEPLDGVSLQAAWFRTDFDNLIAVGSIAGGNTPLSQGEAEFQGLELSGRVQARGGWFGRLALTTLPTARQTTAFRNVANDAVVGVAGNRQPYAPRRTLTAATGFAAGPLHAEVEAQYVGEQFSDFANTVAPTADGQRGLIESYTVFNASLNYRFAGGLSSFVALKNLTDRVYIVDRTRGIQVGQPRLVQVGLRYAF